MPVTERQALAAMASDIAEILRLLARMRYRALTHNLPITIPASQPYAELIDQLAKLKQSLPPLSDPSGALAPHEAPGT